MAGSVEVKAQEVGIWSGEALLLSAKTTLGIWGGMSNSIRPDEDGDSSISFDLRTVRFTGREWNRGRAAEAVFAWLDSLGVEYSVTFNYWKE